MNYYKSFTYARCRFGQIGSQLAQSAWRTWLDLLLPKACRGCFTPTGNGGGDLCEICLGKLSYLEHGICRLCGASTKSRQAGGMICGQCLRQHPHWDLARSVVYYDEPIRSLLHRLKYHGDTTVLPAIVSILREWNSDWVNDADYILPVPMHRSRLQERGLNHAVFLAKLFRQGENQRVVPSLLKRKRDTLPQTGLNGKERRRNLRGAFIVDKPAMIRGCSVCLVDDVYTTGTTLQECSKVIRRAGATRITAITVARVKIGQM